MKINKKVMKLKRLEGETLREIFETARLTDTDRSTIKDYISEKLDDTFRHRDTRLKYGALVGLAVGAPLGAYIVKINYDPSVLNYIMGTGIIASAGVLFGGLINGPVKDEVRKIMQNWNSVRSYEDSRKEARERLS